MRPLALASLALLGCVGSPSSSTDGAPPDAAPDFALPACALGVYQGVACTRGDATCQIPGASTEASPLHCFCPCSGPCWWETDLVGTICDGGIDGARGPDAPLEIYDLSGDLTDMCLSMPLVTVQVAGTADGGVDCFIACEPARPPGYFGPSTCTQVAVDGGQALDCTFAACGL
jgi:hypothetical protein